MRCDLPIEIFFCHLVRIACTDLLLPVMITMLSTVPECNCPGIAFHKDPQDQIAHQITVRFTIELALSMAAVCTDHSLASGLTALPCAHHASASTARSSDHLWVRGSNSAPVIFLLMMAHKSQWNKMELALFSFYSVVTQNPALAHWVSIPPILPCAARVVIIDSDSKATIWAQPPCAARDSGWHCHNSCKQTLYAFVK